MTRLAAGSLLALLLTLALGGCSAWRRGAEPPEPPTLADLRERRIVLRPDPGPPRDEARIAAAYRDYLAVAGRDAPGLALAERRVADLAMEAVEQRAAEGQAADYREVVTRYQAWLAAHPQAEGRDAVLYQLARAQEQGGDGGAALATLQRLVAAHPQSSHRDEAEFRRGEQLFAQRRWAEAEAAYDVVLQAGAGSPWTDRALYMQGWSRYRQGRWNEALESFLAVLDLKLGGGEALPRAEQELVDDSLRVTALALEQLQGAATLAGHVQGSERRRRWAWRAYEQLAALYQRQGRVRDASDTLRRYAEAHPRTAQAAQARLAVIDLHEGAGFAALALQARREFALAHPGHERRAEQLDPLARHHHAAWQATRDPAEADEAERWYALAEAGLNDARRGERRFLRAELAFEAGRFEAARQAYELAAYGDADHPRRVDAAHGLLLALERLPGTAAAERRQAAERFVQRFAGDPRAAAVRAQLAFDAGDWAAAERAYAERLAVDPAAAERLAASIWRQAEAAREAGRAGEAARHFARLAEAVPASAAAPAALYDAALQAIAAREWDAAAAALRTLRARHPRHELAAQVAPQLALAEAERGQPRAAALELEAWSGQLTDADAARQARWQAAELFERAGDAERAAALWQRVAADGGAPLPQQVQARWRLAERARAQGRARDETALLRALLAAEEAAGERRTPATRTLAAQARLRLAEPLAEAFRAVPLAEPLKASLARKKARFEAALAAYAEAAATGSPEGWRAATEATAALYQDFGRALLAAPAPRGLRKADQESYRVLMEEQALPFEEKAAELRRTLVQAGVAR